MRNQYFRNRLLSISNRYFQLLCGIGLCSFACFNSSVEDSSQSPNEEENEEEAFYAKE